MEGVNIEAALEARDQAERDWKSAAEEAKKQALKVPTEEELQAIIEADRDIDDELAYFTEDIQRIFQARLKGAAK